ncbi:DUF1186 domain-containing protein [Devosia sp. Root105]|uniref:DUF1186 domain-containing protein n=1 Tax=Devosia sp. Root105 TaxID=1736423 RepID=UPI0006FAD156|nr:DUF1186 domain-containing protein [Devosia sp. Root105]KQV08683.1 hypothetical protein ASC68_25535 [Devosia sp. Root105]
MKTDDLAALFDRAAGDLGTIDQHLQALATERRLPRLALAMCAARYEEAAPILQGLLDRAAAGAALSEDEEHLLFRGLHIQGGAKDKQVFPALLRLLRRPKATVDRLLGYAITETLARIVGGVFDGDADALFALIADRKVDEFVRDAVFGAATFLTWEGSISAERMHGFVQRFYDERLAGNQDYAWIGWLEAIALLGQRDLVPLVDRAWDEGRIDTEALRRHHFDSDLARAENAPGDVTRFRRARLGHIEDVVEALEWTDRSYEDEADTVAAWADLTADPVTNPWRGVGRNDPCPCGSGKKAKRCHLA